MTKEEIQAHWEYVKGILEHEIPFNTVFTKDDHIQSIGFHYKTAMAHGAKHQKELNDAD